MQADKRTMIGYYTGVGHVGGILIGIALAWFPCAGLWRFVSQWGRLMDETWDTVAAVPPDLSN